MLIDLRKKAQYVNGWAIFKHGVNNYSVGKQGSSEWYKATCKSEILMLIRNERG